MTRMRHRSGPNMHLVKYSLPIDPLWPHFPNGSKCDTLMRALTHGNVSAQLSSALRAARGPAVMMLVTCNEAWLLQNFVCSLSARNMTHVLAHMVVWVADDCAEEAITTRWPGVQLVRLQATLRIYGWHGKAHTGGTEKHYGSGGGGYAVLGMMKVAMPFAAYTLGYDAVTSDVDVVWMRNVLSHLHKVVRRTSAELFFTTEHHSDLYFKGNQRRQGTSCSSTNPYASTVNGGFVYARAGMWSAHRVLSSWMVGCPIVISEKRNQPLLQEVVKGVNQYELKRAAGTRRYTLGSGAACVYQPQSRNHTLGKENHTIMVLDSNEYAHGNRDAKLLLRHRRSMRFYHADYCRTWHHKCQKLRELGELHLKLMPPLPSATTTTSTTAATVTKGMPVGDVCTVHWSTEDRETCQRPAPIHDDGARRIHRGNMYDG